MILPLVDRNDPILYKQTDPIDFENPQLDVEKLFNDLKDTLIHHGGLGLAANQVGVPYSAFVMGDVKDPDGILGIFNPTILNVSEEKIYMTEGCLTIPGLFVKIKRPKEIRFRACNFDGSVDSQKFSGISARTFLHEYDHISGVMFTKRANIYHLEKAKKEYDRHLQQKSVR